MYVENFVVKKDENLPSDQEAYEMTLRGVPFWKKLDGYPQNWADLSARQQKWEFLRRNTDYRKAWDSYSEDVGEAFRCFDFGVSKFFDPKRGWPNTPDGLEFLREQKGGQIIEPHARPRFHDDPKRSSEEIELERDAEIAWQQSHVPPDWYALTAWVEFDISANLDDQLMEARNNLLKMREEAKKFMDRLASCANGDDYGDYPPLPVEQRKATGLQWQTKLSKYSGCYPILLLRVPEVCERYSISRSTLYRDIKDGKIKVVKRGKSTLLARADIQAWANA